MNTFRSVGIFSLLWFCHIVNAQVTYPSWGTGGCSGNVSGRPFACSARGPSAIGWCEAINVSGEFSLYDVSEGQGWVICDYIRSAGGRPYGIRQFGSRTVNHLIGCPRGGKYSAESKQCVSEKEPDEECTGNPIDVLSGAKIQSEKIVTVSVPGGLITLSKYYRSFPWLKDESEVLSSAGSVHTWTFSFTDRIEVSQHTVNIGYGPEIYYHLHWTRPDGERKTFSGTSPDALVSQDPSVLAATPNTPGSHQSGYLIKDRNGDEYKFNGSGYLIGYKKFDSFEIEFQIVSTYTRKAIINGVEFFAIKRGFKLETTELSFPSGDKYVYSYDSGLNLLTETYPDQTTKTYHYEDINFPRLLTGITDNKGIRYATWSYDSAGRAILSKHAGDVDMVSLDYTHYDDAQDPRVKETNPLGKETTYHLEYISDSKKIVNVEGHQSTNCLASSSYKTYYTTGLVQTETDRSGNVTYYEYDASNRLYLKAKGYQWSGSPMSGVVTNVLAYLTAPSNANELNTTKYCWNDAGGLEREVNARSVEIYSYLNGNLQSKTLQPRSTLNENCIP